MSTEDIINNDYICRYCGKHFSQRGITAHIVYAHKANFEDYVKTYYHIDKSIVSWYKIGIADIKYIKLICNDFPSDSYKTSLQLCYDKYKDLRLIANVYGKNLSKLFSAVGINIDRTLSDTTKRKISIARTNKHYGHYTQKLSPEKMKLRNEKISRAHTGQRKSDDARKQHALSSTGTWPIIIDNGQLTKYYCMTTAHACYMQILNYNHIPIVYRNTCFTYHSTRTHRDEYIAVHFEIGNEYVMVYDALQQNDNDFHNYVLTHGFDKPIKFIFRQDLYKLIDTYRDKINWRYSIDTKISNKDKDKHKYTCELCGREYTTDKFYVHIANAHKDINVHDYTVQYHDMPADINMHRLTFPTILCMQTEIANQSVFTSYKDLYQYIYDASNGNKAQLQTIYGYDIIQVCKSLGVHLTKQTHYGNVAYRSDIDMMCRSSWEANIIRILQYKHIPYEYEPDKIPVVIHDKTVHYIPDLKINNKYIEIKGKWIDNAKCKYDICKQQHKDLKFHLIGAKEYHWLINRYSNVISFESNWTILHNHTPVKIKDSGQSIKCKICNTTVHNNHGLQAHISQIHHMSLLDYYHTYYQLPIVNSDVILQYDDIQALQKLCKYLNVNDMDLALHICLDKHDMSFITDYCEHDMSAICAYFHIQSYIPITKSIDTTVPDINDCFIYKDNYPRVQRWDKPTVIDRDCTCMICNKKVSSNALLSHVTQTHNIIMDEYMQRYYNIPVSAVSWYKIGVADIKYIKLICNDFPSDSYKASLQLCYDKYHNMTIISKMYHHNMARIFAALDIKKNE